VENDWRADRYEPNDFGGDDSVVDLTDIELPAKKLAKRRPTKATTAKA